MIQLEFWSPAGDLTLEPNAEKAVTSLTESLAVIAGPGAGKTELLAQRADFLLRTNTCKYPKRILAISFKKDAAVNLKDRVKKRCGSEFSKQLDSYTFHAFAKRIIDIFRTQLDGQDRLNENYSIGPNRIPEAQVTFNDLVPLAISIVENFPTAKRTIIDTYTDVFLDEFQDCTDLQYRLFNLLFVGSRARLVAVGDEKQRIMKWANAMDGVFGTFISDFNTKPIQLLQNFRSADRIRRVQNELVKSVFPHQAISFEEISSDQGFVHYEHFSTDKDEACWISEEVDKRLKQGQPINEIAILCKSQISFYAARIMTSLSTKGIPFRNEHDAQDVFAELLIETIIDFITLILNCSTPDSWIRLQERLVPDSLEDDTRAAEWEFYLKSKITLAKGISTANELWPIVDDFITELGIEAIMSLSVEYENGDYYQTLLTSAREQICSAFDSSHDKQKAILSLGQTQAVRILTIHKCKGMEFDTVFIQGIENETFWTRDNKPSEHEENLCAYFVALSRAKKDLVLTTCSHRSRPEGAWKWNTSRTPFSSYLTFVTPHCGGSAI